MDQFGGGMGRVSPRQRGQAALPLGCGVIDDVSSALRIFVLGPRSGAPRWCPPPSAAPPPQPPHHRLTDSTASAFGEKRAATRAKETGRGGGHFIHKAGKGGGEIGGG